MKTKPITLVKIVVLGLALVGLGVFAHHQFSRRGQVDEYNRIVDLYNAQKYEQAAEGFAELLPRTEGEMRRQVRQDLLKTYLVLGDDPSRPTRESARWYRKAYRMDPNALSEQQIRTMRLYADANAPTTRPAKE
ncbi:MAG: hypothetical protein ACLFV7_05880 [Phycisphaerae bacterium]